jgi:NitT/TauT family transport system ATP-binding protein
VRGDGVILEDVSFSFGNKIVFDQVSLVLTESPVVILGPSGCGKTTLLRLIAGLLPPQRGSIFFGEREGGACSFVFQEPRLLPYLSVQDNIMLPAKKHLPKDALHEKLSRLLLLTGLAEEARRYPDELSGGQRQRVAIARAFCYPAPLLLLDEPFQSLDLPLRFALLETVKTLLSGESRFVIAVTHDPREAALLGKRILVLGKNGRVVFDAKNDGRGEVKLEKGIIDGLSGTSEKE